MKIFIPSYNRPGLISTHLLLEAEGIDYRIVLADELQKIEYLKNPSIVADKIIVAHIKPGVALVRNWILEHLVIDGEWYMTMDDNITGFEKVVPEHYDKEAIAVKTLPPVVSKDMFNASCSAKEFMYAVEDTVKKADEIEAKYCTFASTDNPFFRGNKWRTVGYGLSCVALIKKSHLRFNIQIRAMDDYGFTAQNLVEFGKILVNNFARPVKKHYQPGGIGTYDERVMTKIADAQYLMYKYPGLFRYNKKSGTNPLAEIVLVPNTPDKLEKWLSTRE